MIEVRPRLGGEAVFYTSFRRLPGASWGSLGGMGDATRRVRAIRCGSTWVDSAVCSPCLVGLRSGDAWESCDRKQCGPSRAAASRRTTVF